jgi:hypothetical protein
MSPPKEIGVKQKRQITVVGDKAIVPLTRGFVAQIDADDMDKVVGYNWFAVVQKHGAYAVRRVAGVKGRGSKVSMHRTILQVGEHEQVDHIDLNGLNNCKANLRVATPMQNTWNRRRSAANTSGLKGVCWNKASKKWQSQIRVKGKNKYLGLFETSNLAHLAYCEAAKLLHGQFARIQ